MKVIAPFGPKIAKLKISNQSLIKKMNNEIEKIYGKKLKKNTITQKNLLAM